MSALNDTTLMKQIAFCKNTTQMPWVLNMLGNHHSQSIIKKQNGYRTNGSAYTSLVDVVEWIINIEVRVLIDCNKEATSKDQVSTLGM